MWLTITYFKITHNEFTGRIGRYEGGWRGRCFVRKKIQSSNTKREKQQLLYVVQENGTVYKVTESVYDCKTNRTDGFYAQRLFQFIERRTLLSKISYSEITDKGLESRAYCFLQTSNSLAFDQDFPAAASYSRQVSERNSPAAKAHSLGSVHSPAVMGMFSEHRQSMQRCPSSMVLIKQGYLNTENILFVFSSLHIYVYGYISRFKRIRF